MNFIVVLSYKFELDLTCIYTEYNFATFVTFTSFSNHFDIFKINGNVIEEFFPVAHMVD